MENETFIALKLESDDAAGGVAWYAYFTEPQEGSVAWIAEHVTLEGPLGVVFEPVELEQDQLATFAGLWRYRAGRAVRKCMREYCDEPRWIDPVKGETVLCHEHVQEVFRGERRAPPLRRCIDYCATSRPTFLVMEYLDTLEDRDANPQPAEERPDLVGDAKLIDEALHKIMKRRGG